MTAAYVDRPGPARAIRVGEVPVPTPGSAEVLVAVDQVAVDPVDTYVRSGRYPTPMPLPFVVGRDLVGRVAVVGAGVDRFRPGDPVWCNSLGHEGRQGSFAQYAVVPVDRLYRVPEGVEPELVVAVAHPAATAYLGWFVHAGLRPGETVFVGGAAGNVGTAAVQLAALAGARVVATAAPRDHDRCRAAGAAVVLDYADPSLADRLADAAPDGVHIHWETSGHHDFDLVARTAAPGARVLMSASAQGSTPVPWGALYTRDVQVLGFVISRARAEDLADAAALVNEMLAGGRLTARIAQRLPLADAAEAHERLEAGGVEGRLVLRVS